MTARMSVAEFKGRKKKHKYGAQSVTVDGERFASTKEWRRWKDLLLLQRGGYIGDLVRQVSYDLTVNSQHICNYIADFQYRENGQLIVEDSKGVRTPEYKLKKKLMKAIYGIEIKET